MRLLGLLPLLFFFAQAVHYWRINQLGHILWMCNIGNLVLAVGLFFEKPVVIRLASIWMVPGLIIWFIYVVLAWGVFLTSTLAHVGFWLVAAGPTVIALYYARGSERQPLARGRLRMGTNVPFVLDFLAHYNTRHGGLPLVVRFTALEYLARPQIRTKPGSGDCGATRLMRQRDCTTLTAGSA